MTDTAEPGAAHSPTDPEAFQAAVYPTLAQRVLIPLGAVTGELEFLFERLGADEQIELRSDFARIRADIEAMQRLITDILSTYILQQPASDRDSVDLVDISRRAFEAGKPHADRAALNYDLTLPDDLLLIYGSDVKLYTAMSNLIDNAIKYNRPGGLVNVRLETLPGSARFVVSDTGLGIPTDYQDLLFAPFYRAERPETQTISGNGLGLFVVKYVVEAHSGSVFYETNGSSGSTFGFEVPVTGA